MLSKKALEEPVEGPTSLPGQPTAPSPDFRGEYPKESEGNSGSRPVALIGFSQAFV
jgi:hypothetical protein